MFDILDGFVSRAESTLLGVMTVIAIAMAAWTWTRTKSLGPTVGSLFLGALVIYAVSNYDTLSKEIEKDVDAQRQGCQTIDAGGERITTCKKSVLVTKQAALGNDGGNGGD